MFAYMKKVLAAVVSFLTVCSFEAEAQLYSLGNDPGTAGWKQISTANFRVVYPAGMDSLAKEYAVSLEKWSARVSATIGYKPNQCHKRPMPVILHPYMAECNGTVTLAPRRVELFTVPDYDEPLPMSSMEQLVLHESRHVAQMQFGFDKPYRFLNVLLGELWPGAMSALYPGPAFLEGDAVVAETELSSSGRGRTSGFLEYYDICFSEGDFRDYYKWRYGSQKNYTPDLYRAGYLLIGGVRNYFDDPYFTARYFKNVNSGFLPFFVFEKTVRQASGMNFKKTFAEISSRQKEEWEENAGRRAPFMPAEKITAPERLYTSFRGNVTDGEVFYSIRSGLAHNAELVRVHHDGQVDRLCPLSSSTNNLSFCDSTRMLYWSEYRQDPRWELKSSYVIRSMDKSGKVRDLTRPGKKYYNPTADGDRIYAAEYPDGGGSAVVVLDAGDGSVLQRVPAPAGMQIVEFCCIDGNPFFSAVTEDGSGIYDSSFKPVLAPSRAVLSNLFSRDGKIFFTADRNGSKELYAVNPADGSVQQFTSSRFGGNYYRFCGDSLYFISDRRKDCGYYRTAVSDLPVRKIDFSDQVFPSFAEKLSDQVSRIRTDEPDTSIISIRNYSKAAHLFKFHSWLPAYVNFDAIADLSLESVATDAGLGATALFHNDLNTMQGFVGWSAWTGSSGWRNALHGKFEYSGWYPVLDISFDLGERNAIQYFPSLSCRNSVTRQFNTRYLDTPYFKTGIKAYVPLNFSSGGWNRGLIPQLEWTMSNDVFSTGSELKYINVASASLRGYSMLPVASSCIYPRLGIGAEAGCRWNPQLTGYTVTTKYLFLYGYLPGIMRTHGIRLASTYESASDNHLNVHFTYALPFAPVDWSFLCPVAYVRNFEFKANVTAIKYFTDSTKDRLLLGGDLAARLGNLLWIPYDTRIGISVTWDTVLNNIRTGLLFSIDL